jgi:putative PEP-CTERM system TPR-repeat lipoprotein
MHILARNIAQAKEQLDTIRDQEPDSFETRYLSANIALAEKNHDKALRELQAALAQDPKRIMTYIDIGGVYVLKKEFKAAEESYKKALEFDAKFTGARIALANLYLAQGDQEKAEEQLLVATKTDPENEGLLHVLGTFYSRTRQIDDLEKLYMELLQKKPDSMIARKRLAEIALLKGDHKKAKAYAEEILKADSGDVDGHYFRGRVALAGERNYKGARDEFGYVARTAPKFAPAFYYLSLTQLRLNQIHDAKTSLVKATELNPLWIQPRLTLAQVHLTLGEHNIAWQELETILRAQPKNRRALQLAGAAQMRKGDVTKALALFKRAQELNPRDPTSHLNLGAAYGAQKKYLEALKEYEAALKSVPDLFPAVRSIVQIHVRQGNRRAAFERLQQYLAKTKDQGPVYQLMGELSLGDKDSAKAVEYLQKSIEVNPDLLSSYFLIGQVYAAQGKFDQAIEQYQKMVQKNPRAVPANMMLGVIYDRRKETNKANEYYQKVLDINKNFAPAANNLAWNYAEYGGNLDIALGLAQKAREIRSDDPNFADTLGWIHYKKGTYLTAIGLLKESNEKFEGKNATVLYHLGMAYYKSGDKKLGRELLNKALSLNQNFTGAEEAKRIVGSLQG